MNTKKAQREAALKKAKKKRTIILAAFAACVVAIVVFAILVYANQPRVFSADGQSVTLHEGGSFSASLAHGTSISGTFTEQVDGNVTAVLFTHGGNTVSTQIVDDVLLLPIEWRVGCAHGHAVEFPLRR